VNTDSLWIGPLLLLPGVALLVLSTSTRFGQLHDEFHRRQEEGDQASLRLLRRRARLFRSALVSLYVSVALLAVASVLGTIANHGASSSKWIGPVSWMAQGMTVLAVISVAHAALQLIRESSILLSVLEDNEERANKDPAIR
jgi:hypothetical protein